GHGGLAGHAVRRAVREPPDSRVPEEADGGETEFARHRAFRVTDPARQLQLVRQVIAGLEVGRPADEGRPVPAIVEAAEGGRGLTQRAVERVAVVAGRLGGGLNAGETDRVAALVVEAALPDQLFIKA